MAVMVSPLRSIVASSGVNDSTTQGKASANPGKVHKTHPNTDSHPKMLRVQVPTARLHSRRACSDLGATAKSRIEGLFLFGVGNAIFLSGRLVAHPCGGQDGGDPKQKRRRQFEIEHDMITTRLVVRPWRGSSN